MRTAGLALVAVTALMGFASLAEAGVTCKVVPSWCPSEGSGGTNKSLDNKGSSTNHGSTSASGTTGTPKTSVPEPGTLLLLGAGVSAVGGAVFRRRQHKKD